MRSDPTWSSSGCVKSSIASLFTMDATYACTPYTAKHSCHENRCGDGSRHKPCLFRYAETRLSDSCHSNLDEPLTHKRLRFGDIVLLAKLGKDLTNSNDGLSTALIGVKTDYSAHFWQQFDQRPVDSLPRGAPRPRRAPHRRSASLGRGRECEGTAQCGEHKRTACRRE